MSLPEVRTFWGTGWVLDIQPPWMVAPFCLSLYMKSTVIAFSKSTCPPHHCTWLFLRQLHLACRLLCEWSKPQLRRNSLPLHHLLPGTSPNIIPCDQRARVLHSNEQCSSSLSKLPVSQFFLCNGENARLCVWSTYRHTWMYNHADTSWKLLKSPNHYVLISSSDHPTRCHLNQN